MATTFHEVVLDEMYSADADGGPEWSTAIIRAGEGGSISSRAVTREDYQSKYEIQYKELERERQELLRQFCILRRGMAYGFRFLAPDDNELEDENVGWLNPATGEVEYLAATPASNTLDEFYLVKHYSDQAANYTRRIVKPSPFHDVVIEWWEDISGTPTLKGSETLAAESTLLPFGVIDPDPVEFAISAPGLYQFTFDFINGKITSDIPLGDDEILKVSCTYHLPVAFTEDWAKFAVDVVTISELKVGIEEILPIELGIT